MAFSAPQVIVPSATQTTTGVSGAISNYDLGNALSVFVNVTAISGTPNMGISVEWSMDGTTFAVSDPVDTMTPITATGAAVKTFELKAPWYRFRWTIAGGTPSLTFAISAYVTP
jgi:hypothetical protein